MIIDRKGFLSLAADLADTRSEFEKARLLGDSKKYYNIAVKNIQNASQLHLVDLVLEFTKACLHYHSQVKPNANKISHYKSLYNKYWKLKQKEERVTILYADFIYKLNKNKLTQIEDSIIHEFEELVKGELSYNIALKSYYALSIYYIHTDNGENTLKICENALTYFGRLNFDTKNVVEVFSLSLAPIYIKKKQYVETERLLINNLPKKKSITYFVFCQYLCLNYFQSQQYSKCRDFVFKTSVTSMPERVKEPWEIYKAYAAVLGELGIIENKHKYNFRKLINDLKFFNSDKKGHYFNIIIIEVLFSYARFREKLIDQ